MPIPWSKDRGIGYFHFLLLKLGYSNKTNNPNDSPNKRMFGLFSCGRSGEAQTRGLRIPNAARYQLRYTPIVIKLWSCKWSNLWSKVFCRNTWRRKSEKTRGKRRFCELSAVGSRGGHTLPNFARYQLRHTPIGENIQFFCQICKWSNLWSKVFCRRTRRRKSEKMRGKRRFCELSEVGSRGGHTLPKQAGNRYPTSRHPVRIPLSAHEVS